MMYMTDLASIMNIDKTQITTLKSVILREQSESIRSSHLIVTYN